MTIPQNGFKMNILIIENPVANAVTYWRFLRPLGEMQRQFPGRFNIRTTRKLDAADLFYTDVFLLSRPNDVETLNMVKRIRDAGRSKIIMDIDDAITNVPVHHTHSAYFNNRAHIAREIFGLVDHFWVSTEQLLYECDCLGRGEIIPNAVLPGDLPKEPAPDRGVWMWRGRDVQKEDVYLSNAVEWYEANKYKAKEWVFWGCLPSLNHAGNVKLWEYEDDVQKYFATLKKQPFNGVWKPLVDNQFNDAKSNIAWIEATMSGGVCVTNYAGKTSWEGAMLEMPESYDHAVVRWELSCEYIKRDFNLETTARQRAESLERVLNNQTVLA
jgi:hypothetical protein